MINFDEVLHKYTDADGNTYISVTQLIGLYKQPFDTVAVSKRYAEKNGQTPEYWQQKWEHTKNEACDRGTLFHEEQEDLLLGRGVDMNRGKPVEVQNPGLQMRMVQSVYDLPDGLYPELRLWHAGYRLAGTGDKAFLETIGHTRYADLDDHKTNKAIYTKSWVHPTQGPKMMKYPVAHIMDCNFWHYALQISFYMYMLECEGFVPRDLQFTHYPHQNPDNPFEDIKPQIYKLPYLRDEVIAILEDYRKQNRKRR